MEYDWIWWQWFLEEVAPVTATGFFISWWILRRIDRRKKKALLINAIAESKEIIRLARYNARRADIVQENYRDQPTWTQLEYERVTEYYYSVLFHHDDAMTDCLEALIRRMKIVNTVIGVLNMQYEAMFTDHVIIEKRKNLYKVLAEQLAFNSTGGDASVERLALNFLKLVREREPKAIAKRAVLQTPAVSSTPASTGGYE